MALATVHASCWAKVNQWLLGLTSVSRGELVQQLLRQSSPGVSMQSTTRQHAADSLAPASLCGHSHSVLAPCEACLTPQLAYLLYLNYSSLAFLPPRSLQTALPVQLPALSTGF